MTSHPGSLEGKVALITGGSRGIGAATVRLFVSAGARVVFNYQKAKEQAQKLVDGCGSDRCTAIPSDLSSIDSARELVEAAVRQYGKLDVLVANHGVWPPEDAPVERMSDDQWRFTVSINLDSVFGLLKHAVKQMKSQPATGKAAGHIVLVSSTAGQRGEAFHADYGATKGAVIALTKSLAVELAPRLTVNCVAPGWVDTEMAALPYARNGGQGRREIERGIPLGRVASAEDVAGPIVFLCSSLARHITGEVIKVVQLQE